LTATLTERYSDSRDFSVYLRFAPSQIISEVLTFIHREAPQCQIAS